MQFLRLIVGGWKTWVHQCGDQSCIWYQFSQKAQLLGLYVREKNINPCKVATGAIDAGHEACLDRIVSGCKHDGYR